MPPCALALVLLLDVSGSVTPERFALQRDATAEALASPRLAQMVASQPGGVALAALQFGSRPHLVVPWRHLRDAPGAEGFAAALRAGTRREAGQTGVARALEAALDLLDAPPCAPERQMVDVSGDGHDNTGEDLEAVRERAVAAGVAVNVLPIVTEEAPDLAEWFRAHVLTPGGFLVVAEGWGDFARAITRKLTFELAAAR